MDPITFIPWFLGGMTWQAIVWLVLCRK